MDELMEFMIPNGENYSLVDPVEHIFWRGVKSRCFYLDYEIGDDYRCVELAKFIIQMNIEEQNIPQNQLEPIKLFIFSYGGSIDQAQALCDIIEASRIPIITVCMGVAMSAGFLIFLAGKFRYAMSQSTFLAHQGNAVLSGNASEIEECQKNYQKTLDKMRDYILSHTTIDKKTFDRNRKKDWYITGKEEIEKYGIAKVIKSFDEIA